MKLSSLVLFGGVVLSQLALVACGGSSSGSDSSSGKTQQETMQMTEVTNKSQCTGSPTVSAGVNSIWHKHFRGQSQHYSATIDNTFDLSTPGFLTFSNYCQFSNGKNVVASVQVPVLISGNTIEILRSGQKTTEDNSSSTSASCTIGVAKTSVQYELVGSCLKIIKGGNSDYFVSY